MRFILTGGGTLGSVTPLLAVAAELRSLQPSAEFQWFGTFGGPERSLVERAGIPFVALSSGKLRRYLSVENALDIGRIGVGFATAFWHFGLARPSLVLSAGAYVAVPVGYAAAAYGVPVLIHQQDVTPGLANRLLAPIARAITVAFPESAAGFTRSKVTVTGNPVRRELGSLPDRAAARRELGLDPAMPTVVVTGGGTGAATLNQLAAAAFTGAEPFQVLHLTGRGKVGEVQPRSRYHVLPFSEEPWVAFAAADVVVSRAGMGTLTELAAFRKAAVVVPMAGTHQEANAQLLAARGAAIVRHEASLTAAGLAGTVSELLSNAVQRQQLGDRLAELFPTGAAAAVARVALAQLHPKLPNLA